MLLIVVLILDNVCLFQASSVAMDPGEMFGNHGGNDPLPPCFSEEHLDEGGN